MKQYVFDGEKLSFTTVAGLRRSRKRGTNSKSPTSAWNQGWVPSLTHFLSFFSRECFEKLKVRIRINVVQLRNLIKDVQNHHFLFQNCKNIFRTVSIFRSMRGLPEMSESIRFFSFKCLTVPLDGAGMKSLKQNASTLERHLYKLKQTIKLKLKINIYSF